MKSRFNKILLIYTGGTIGMVKDYRTGALKAFNFKELLSKIPELYQLEVKIEVISFDHPIDSSEMNVENWVHIVQLIEDNYLKYDGFVILTGSDTMAYTASALSFMLDNLSKPVILTGSQLPIGFLRTDAKENLISSIHMASITENSEPIIKEVCIYFEYKLYRGNRTTKLSTKHFNAFASFNYPPLAEREVNIVFHKNNFFHPSNDNGGLSLITKKKLNNDIALLKLFPGITREFVVSVFSMHNLKGVIIETYGAGNTLVEKWFIDILDRSIKKGVHIVSVTQCIGGSVLMGHYQNSIALRDIGVISGGDITTESAIAKMMYMIGEQIPYNRFKQIFETSLRGELTV